MVLGFVWRGYPTAWVMYVRASRGAAEEDTVEWSRGAEAENTKTNNTAAQNDEQRTMRGALPKAMPPPRCKQHLFNIYYILLHTHATLSVAIRSGGPQGV